MYSRYNARQWQAGSSDAIQPHTYEKQASSNDEAAPGAAFIVLNLV